MKSKKIFEGFDKRIIYIFLIALFLRIYKLNLFPIGITHDELNYIITAKSLFLTGSFIPQTAPSILPTYMPFYNVVIAEMPAFILSPFIGLLDFSMFSSRFPGAFFSSLTCLVLYFLTYEITKNKKISLLSSLVFSLNPWSLLMGRSVFEVNFYIFFFLTGFLILLRSRGWRIFYSLPFYMMGFFSYTGGQPVFYLFIIVTIIFKYFSGIRQKITPSAVYVIVVSIVFVGYLLVSLKNQSMISRGGELYLPVSNAVSKEVDAERLTSVPSKYNRIFINKISVYAKGFLEKYLDAYSPLTLFVNGELRAAFSYQKHGPFYAADLIFLIIGICYMFMKRRKVWTLLMSILIIAPLTSGLSVIEHSYSQRAGLMYPALIIFISAGGYYVLNKGFGEGRKKIFVKVLLILIYVVSFANLYHIYFYRFPVYASDGWFYQDRLLSEYIQLTRQKNAGVPINVYSSEPKITFEEYLYFTKAYNKETAILINANLGKGIFSFNNVTFTFGCSDNRSGDSGTVEIFDSLLNCDLNKEEMLRITRFQDVFEKYLIGNDILCGDADFKTYVDPESFKNFNIESIEQNEFCNKWLTKLNF